MGACLKDLPDSTRPAPFAETMHANQIAHISQRILFLG